MSKIESQRKFLISTLLGNVFVKSKLLSDFDVEDIVRNKGTSQGRVLQFINLGKQINENAQLPTQSLPSIFTDVEDEELVEE